MGNEYVRKHRAKTAETADDSMIKGENSQNEAYIGIHAIARMLQLPTPEPRSNARAEIAV